MDPSQSYTVLRIKRKRNEEPLDALVIESSVRRKKRGGLNVFQYAQTVEPDAWEDEKQRRVLQDEISRLASGLPGSGMPPVPAKPSPTPIPNEQPQRRYTVVMQSVDDGEHRRKIPVAPSSPPKVVPAATISSSATQPQDKANTPKDWKLYDAVLHCDLGSGHVEDEEMAKFMPMLNDYLKLHDIDVSAASNAGEAMDEDFVYDVFYRPSGARVVPTMSEWNALAVGANVATLVGYDSSDDEEGAEGEEVEDEADEDSNDEGWYKNDYPEGEDDDSSDLNSDRSSAVEDSSDDWDKVDDEIRTWR